jgi:hypothetical protein
LTDNDDFWRFSEAWGVDVSAEMSGEDENNVAVTTEQTQQAEIFKEEANKLFKGTPAGLTPCAKIHPSWHNPVFRSI